MVSSFQFNSCKSSHCCDKKSDEKELREERFLLVHGSRVQIHHGGEGMLAEAGHIASTVGEQGGMSECYA